MKLPTPNPSIPTIPQTEIDTLVAEGNDLLNNQIRVTFQQSDIDQAEGYHSNYNCYLCVALRRMGYNVIRVSANFARINKSDELWFFAGITHPSNPIHQQFAETHPEKSIVGKTLVLTKA